MKAGKVVKRKAKTSEIFYRLGRKICGMEISKIDEILNAQFGPRVERHCKYDPNIVCSAPNAKLLICQDCPRALETAEPNTMRSVFKYINTFAISLMSRMGMGSCGGVGGGTDGGGGAGAGGGK